MLTKERDETVVVCDECGTEEYNGTMDFRDFIDLLKREGWKFQKVEEEWQHACPSCNG